MGCCKYSWLLHKFWSCCWMCDLCKCRAYTARNVLYTVLWVVTARSVGNRGKKLCARRLLRGLALPTTLAAMTSAII